MFSLTVSSSSGFGKTFAAQIYLERKRLEGAKCFVIAPIKGYEHERLCANLGGQHIKFSTDGDNHTNLNAQKGLRSKNH